MKNHTPAPWHPHRSESGFVIVYSDGENRSHVARLFDSTLCEEHGNLELNAHLIASAPELLNALELVFSNASESPEWIRARIGPVIAKAKGEA